MRAAGFLMIAVAAVSPLSAQTLGEACATLSKMAVGQWAEYRLTSPEIPGGSATMRFAIVGTEEANGRSHYWHETKMGTPMGEMIAQILIPGYPYEEGDIARMIVKAGDQPAMEMSAQMMAMMARGGGGGESPARGAAENCGAATLVGTESITVGAGTFETMHIRPTDLESGDLWVTTKVPFGIVRFADNRGSAMELTGHGQGAKSSITEQPTKVPE